MTLSMRPNISSDTWQDQVCGTMLGSRNIGMAGRISRFFIPFLFEYAWVTLPSMPSIMVEEKVIDMRSRACMPCIEPIRSTSLRASAVSTNALELADTLVY